MNIIVGITGGIAAYKSPDLVRRLRERGVEVRVVMTEAAQAFIGALSLQAVSGNPVASKLVDSEAEAAMGHIELARWADLIIIAPATANCMAKLAYGLADDLLSTLVLATEAPVVIAPAMNHQMWSNSATQSNLQTLQDRGFEFIGPDSGDQACGETGAGRMTEPNEIANQIAQQYLNAKPLLKGKKLLLTAGPTQEAIDPVRYLTNHSSGKMGYAIAQAAVQAGAEVSLVSGPVSLTAPKGVKLINVTSAADMHKAVMENLTDTDIFIGCAAVADYRVQQQATDKIKKSEQQLVLTMVENIDIIADVAKQSNTVFCVGFAAETQDAISYGQAKLKSKGLDMICVNDVSDKSIGFHSDENKLNVLLAKDNSSHTIEKASKRIVAKQLITLIGQSL